MKWTISPLTGVGLVVFVVYTVVERLVVHLPDWLAIPALVIAVVLIILGGLRPTRDSR